MPAKLGCLAYVVDTDDIAEAALASLKSHVFLAADQIKIIVSKGWIRLEGEVEWQYQKDAAEEAVRYLRGVVGVSNLVTVKPHVSPKEVKTAVEDALKRQAEVEARRVSVETHDGTVILRGTVRSWIEREEAQRAAWAAPGVHLVEDEITVVP